MENRGMTPKGLGVGGGRYLNTDPNDISDSQFIKACRASEKDTIRYINNSFNKELHDALVPASIKKEIRQVDQPEWCNEDIKIGYNPVFWMITTAVVAGLALFLVRSC